MTELSQSTVYEEIRPKNEPLLLVKIREIEKKLGFVTPIKWSMVIFMLLSHSILLTWLGYNLWKGIYIKWRTIIFVFGYAYLGGFGVTAGAHRYWSHRSYKATPAFRWMLGIMFSIANARPPSSALPDESVRRLSEAKPSISTNPAIAIAAEHKLHNWIRDHRVHHKFSEKLADPHDATRGFFFSHMGWLMMMKHPDVIREGRKIDMSDVTSDPVIQFNNRYHLQLKLIFCVIVPICIPPLLWGDTWSAAALAQIIGMHYSWHAILSVNSFAHLYGSKPYNPNINPSQCWFISLVTIGEGWHNYHHTFPWDYKAAELPYQLNVTTLLLDGCAWLGLVSHRKTASPQLVQATIERHHKSHEP